MTVAGETRYLSDVPLVLPARVTIEHLQLRDILQPSSSKGKLLYLNHLKIDEIDFEKPTCPPATFCSLDFRANCLVTGHGLLAAGGQFSELAIRPLLATSPSGTTSSTPTNAGSSSSSHLASQQRQPAPWLLRTPTGGSINNSVAIYPDPTSIAENKRAMVSETSSRSSKALKKEAFSSPLHSRDGPVEGVWFRDGPQWESIAGPSSRSHSSVDEESEAETLAAAYGFERKFPTSSRASVKKSGEYWPREKGLSSKDACCGSISGPGDMRRMASSSQTSLSTLRVFCSNNDRSLKVYKLRPPSGAASSPGLESGLPGLSRSHTLEFPTAVNHCSFSPDGQTLLAVGDTPHVFLYHRHPSSGAFSQITTYSASSDASFSTSWHPDGTKFAVASQDGIISVWDVRSSKKLAELKTSQSSTMLTSLSGMNGASGAARVVKFSPCGRYLAFTEHRLYFHVYDTLTYSRGQRIRIPTSLEDDNIETVEVMGGREPLPSSSTPLLSNFPESRERRTGLLESRLLSSLYGQNRRRDSFAESLMVARRGTESLTSSLRLPSLSGDTSALLSTSPATGPNDSAVNALREAQRSLRAVRERIAARNRQESASASGSGTAAGVGISGPFDPFIADAGFSMAGLGPNFSDGEEDIATIRRIRRETNGQAIERSSLSTSPIRPGAESVHLHFAAELHESDEDDDIEAPLSDYIRRRRNLSRFLPRPNGGSLLGGEGETDDTTSARAADSSTTPLSIEDRLWGRARGRQAPMHARVRRWFPEGRGGYGAETEDDERTPTGSELFERSLAEILEGDSLDAGGEEVESRNDDPDGEAIEHDEPEEEEEGLVFIDDYPPEVPSSSSTSSSRLLPPVTPRGEGGGAGERSAGPILQQRNREVASPQTLRNSRISRISREILREEEEQRIRSSLRDSAMIREQQGENEFNTGTLGVGGGERPLASTSFSSSASSFVMSPFTTNTTIAPILALPSSSTDITDESSAATASVQRQGEAAATITMEGHLSVSEEESEDRLTRLLYPASTPNTATRGSAPSITGTTAMGDAVASGSAAAAAGLESTTGVRGGSRAMGEGRREVRDEGWLNISGLTWDPDGEFLYVSSERCVCRWAVLRAGMQGGEVVGGWEKGELR